MAIPTISRSIVRLAIALVMVAGGGVWLAPAANAQTSVTVSPSLLDLNAEAGATGEQPITLTLNSDTPVDVTAAILPYQTSTAVPSAVEWLTLDEERLTAEPEGVVTFDLSIAVPEDAEAGGYYASVALTTGAPDRDEVASEGGQASVQGRVVVPVLIKVGDEEDFDRSATLVRVAPVLEQDGRIGMWGELSNTGNVDIRAPGELSIEDSSGSEIASLEFPETTPILPGETQVIRATGTLPLPEGTEYLVDASIDYGGDDPATGTATFTVAPVRPEGDLTICENLDRGPTVGLQLRNTGDIGVSPVVALTIQDENGNQVVSTTLPGSIVLWPLDQQALATDAPARLETGLYTLVAQVQAGAGEPTMIELPFEIGGASDLTAPLCPPPATPTE